MSDSIKKRKWDQDDHGDNSKSSKLNKVDVDPSKAASEAAARINAMLAQKGIPLHENIEKKDGAFVKDIPINDLKNRYMLIKGATHVQIHEETGADVITRGKYYPDKSLSTDREPPLYLHVSAATKEALEKAIEKIEELIETAQVPAPGSFSDYKNDIMKRNERKFFEKILPVEVTGTPHFNLRAKIVGPSGAFVKHINQETGCRVQLKGRGSGFLETNTGKESEEPLHVHLSCPREEGLQAGIKLTQDLLDTVKQEAERGAQYGGYRGGYNNGGYNNGNYNYDYSQSNTSAPPPPSSAGSNNPAASTSTTGEYDYEAYREYYNNYYSQQDPNAAYSQDYQQYDQQQYDANAYYGYYGYNSTEGEGAPPPPGSSTNTPPPPPPSASGPPPPPSASGPPPPPSASGPPPPPPGASAPPPASSLPPPPPPPPSA